MKSQKQRLGAAGEKLTCRVLRSRGYRILARDFKTEHGEVDVIAARRGEIAFVEVKTRSESSLVPARAALTYPQMIRIRRASLAYLERLKHTKGINTQKLTPCYDFAALELGKDGSVRSFRYVKNYFRVMKVDLCGSALRHGDRMV